MARYKVVGPSQRVFGASRGEFVEVVLTPGAERALVEGGHIVPVPKRERPRRRHVEAVVRVKPEPEAEPEVIPEVGPEPSVPEPSGDGASDQIPSGVQGLEQ